MGFKDFHLKLKAFRLRKFVIGDAGKKKREAEFGKRPSWMVPVSHGYHVVEDGSLRGESNDGSDSKPDSVVVQREQIEELEVWFFGVSDARIGDLVTKNMQSHLFDKKPKESQLKRKGKEAMKKAYMGARAKMREKAEYVEKGKVGGGGGGGSASALVINGEKLVIANIGGFRAVVCRDGEAHQINRTRQHHQWTKRRHWSRKLIPGVMRMPKVHIFVRDSSAAVGTNNAANPKKSSAEFGIGDERIDSDTEFVILASTGIWEVMNNQEAVNLIRHLEDPQEAAECLAKEGLTRMSRSNISCLVIRFE